MDTIRGRGRNKRFWTPEEDEILIISLLELSRDTRWKSENGFKSGFMSKLEEMLRAKLPLCGLKAEPHIDSRLKHWSEKYSAMAEMLGISGFGWDSEKKVLQVERSVYEEWIKTHRKAKGLYGLTFPHYEMLAEIYGKDRATGATSESFAKAAHDIDVEIMNESVTIPSDDDFEAEAETESMQSESGASGSRKRSGYAKKQKILKKKKDEVRDLASSLDCVTTEFGKVFKEMNENLGTMAHVWRSEEERKKKLDNDNNNILDELMRLDLLAPSDALEVANVLMAEEHKLRLFYQASTSMKKQFVSDILKRLMRK